MKPNYKFISFFYDLIDVFYFNRKNHSPRTVLLAAVPDAPCRVLDLCAGTCGNSILLAKNKPQSVITALDQSSDMLKVAEKKFQESGIQNIEISVSDACNTNLPDGTFDVIIISLVLHEIDGNTRNAIITEASRILKNNGRLLVIEWEQPLSFFQRLIFYPIKLMEPKGFMDFLRLDLSSYFSNCGFMVLEKRPCDYTRVYTLAKK